VKNALITGGASGFGAEVARQLTRRGDQVVLLDVNDADGKELAGELGGHYLHCDVSDPEQVAATTAEAERLLGGLDLFFLNAGISTGCGMTEDFDLARYRRAMGVNLDGVVFGVQALMGPMRARGGGAIVATASLAGLVGMPIDPLYTANKHGVVGLVRALGPVLAADRIAINAICPGFTETDIVVPIKELLAAQGLDLIDPQVVAETVVRILRSDDAGEAWFVQLRREPDRFRFRNVPGPGAPPA
jgi:NAD(P)-dependent dehydrogenase (short-subunit alcohol dehydrogenase family)